jgi:hypothetical protein
MLQEDFSKDGSDFLFGDVHESNVPEFVRREELISQVAPCCPRKNQVTMLHGYGIIPT